MAKLRWALLAVALAAAGWFMAGQIRTSSLRATPQPGAPDLVVTPTELVFDRVPLRGSVEKPLTFTNTGSYPIQLWEAQGSCSCMQMRLEPTTLLPGESRVFNVVMRGSPVPASLLGGELVIKTSSSTNALVRVTVRATENSGLHTVPETIDFGRPEYEQLPLTSPLKIVLRGGDDSKAASLRIQSSHAAIECGILRRNSDGDYVVDVVLARKALAGNLTGTVAVSGTGFDSLSVPVVATVRHVLSAHPSSLILRKADSGDVMLRDDSGTPVPIHRAVFSSALENQLRLVSRPDNRYRVEWIDSNVIPESLVRGHVELHTRVNELEDLAIMVPILVIGSRSTSSP